MWSAYHHAIRIACDAYGISARNKADEEKEKEREKNACSKCITFFFCGKNPNAYKSLICHHQLFLLFSFVFNIYKMHICI